MVPGLRKLVRLRGLHPVEPVRELTERDSGELRRCFCPVRTRRMEQLGARE